MKFPKSPLLIVAAAFVGAILSGCLNDSGTRGDRDAELKISTKVRDVNKVNGLAKTSVITLSKLIITLTSSDSTDAVRRDTILASDTAGSDFVSDATDDQTFSRNFLVKPLRNWTVVVKTLDVNDSVIHYDSVVAASMLIGETREVTVNLSSRFVMYEAKFTVPDSLNFTQLSLKQQLAITRLVMIVDGDTVADSTTSPRFSPTPTVHTVRFDYININATPDVTIEFHGTVGADSEVKKLFEHEFVNVDPTEPNPVGVEPDYVGPNSNELGSVVGLVINIGKVGTVVFETDINPDVTTKKAVAP